MCATWHTSAHICTSSHRHVHTEGSGFCFTCLPDFSDIEQGSIFISIAGFPVLETEARALHNTCELLFLFLFYHKTGSHHIVKFGRKLTVDCRQALALVRLLLRSVETWVTGSHRTQLTLYFDAVMILKPSFLSCFPSITHRTGNLERAEGNRP